MLAAYCLYLGQLAPLLRLPFSRKFYFGEMFITRNIAPFSCVTDRPKLFGKIFARSVTHNNIVSTTLMGDH